MRKVECDLSVILDLVNSAEDYGFSNSVLLSTLAEITEEVTDAEIAEYAAGFLADEMRAKGYSEEDQEAAVQRVTEWRDRFALGQGADHG